MTLRVDAEDRAAVRDDRGRMAEVLAGLAIDDDHAVAVGSQVHLRQGPAARRRVVGRQSARAIGDARCMDGLGDPLRHATVGDCRRQPTGLVSLSDQRISATEPVRVVYGNEHGLRPLGHPGDDASVSASDTIQPEGVVRIEGHVTMGGPRPLGPHAHTVLNEDHLGPQAPGSGDQIGHVGAERAGRHRGEVLTSRQIDGRVREPRLQNDDVRVTRQHVTIQAAQRFDRGVTAPRRVLHLEAHARPDPPGENRFQARRPGIGPAAARSGPVVPEAQDPDGRWIDGIRRLRSGRRLGDQPGEENEVQHHPESYATTPLRLAAPLGDDETHGME